MSASNFITLHAIHAMPASLLNRDDAGAAKRITFGGTSRLRVSSQAWKRAIRTSMRNTAIDGGVYGLRTTRFPQLTAQQLADTHGRDLDAATAKSAAVFNALKFKATDKGTTAVAIFATEMLPTTVAAAIDAQWDAIGDDVPDDTVAAARAALDVDNTIDLALFGRMLAEVPVGGRIDGAAGVAHAFSVDPQAIEPDFYTAVDDATPEGEAMSGNLGVVQLAAPTLYRSAYLDRRQLRRNLADADNTDELAAQAERAFIDWFIRSVPTSKQRSTVAATLPALVAASTGPQVVSAADAYADAIRSDNVVATATQRLTDALDRQAGFVPGLATERLALAADLPAGVADKAHTTSAAFIDAVAAA